MIEKKTKEVSHLSSLLQVRIIERVVTHKSVIILTEVLEMHRIQT